MIFKLLTEHHLEFLSLKGGCTGSSESTRQNATLLEISCHGSNADDGGSDDSDEDEDRNTGITFDISHYGPCHNCFGWVKKKSLRRHNSVCTSANSWSNRALGMQSDMIAGI